MYGGIGDTARGRRERAEGAGVNYRGLDVRREIVWLPETDTDTKTRMENSRRAVFSVVLTKTRISEMRSFPKNLRLEDAKVKSLPNGSPETLVSNHLSTPGAAPGLRFSDSIGVL